MSADNTDNIEIAESLADSEDNREEADEEIEANLEENSEADKEVNEVDEENVEGEKEDNPEMSSSVTKKKGFMSRNWCWLLAFYITAVFMWIYMIVGKIAPFGMSSFTLIDSIHQYVPFLSDYQDKLINGKSLLYTWDVGLGQNFQSLLLYYMASPLNLIIVLFSRKGIIAMFSLLVSFKISISAGCFGYMLSRRDGEIKNSPVITALSFCYALSGYMCGYYWNIMWLDCIMVFPLIILGFEKLMTKKDARLYILALFYSMYCNYYISFIICVFLVLWFLATGHKNIKGFITDGVRFALASILAAAMAAFSLIMAYLAITKTASAGSALPANKLYQSFFELLKRQYMLTVPVNMDSFDGNANLYCGTLIYILFFVYIFSKAVPLAEKIRKVGLIAFLFVSMNQERLNFIWHGFHNQFGIPNRFSFLYIFTLIYMGYDVLKEIKKTGVFSVVAGVISSSILLALVYYKTDLEGLIPPLYMIIVSYSLIVVYAVFLMLAEEKMIRMVIFRVFMFIFISGEVLTNAWLGIADHGGADGGYYLQYCDVMKKSVGEVEKLADQKGLRFYRSDVVSPIMLDENTFNNMKSIGTFCTTVRGDMVNAMAHLGYYTGSNEYLFLGSNPVTNDLMGMRYIYMRDGDFYPAENDYYTAYNADGVKVLENKNAMSIAYGVSDGISYWDTGTYNCANVINDFAFKAADIETIFEEKNPPYAVTGVNCDASYNMDHPNLISYCNGAGDSITIDATMIVPEDGRYVINIRANYLENIIFYLDDVPLANGRYQTQLFDLGELRAGSIVRFNMEFSESYTEEGTVSMFLSKLNKDNLSRLRGKLQKNEMIVTQMTDDSVKGTVNMDKGQVLFTTIPYDEGWTAYVDGEPETPESIGDGFLCLWLEEGEHDVELRFIPEGMKLGIIITIAGWLIYIILCIVTVKSLKREGSKGKKC